MQLRTPFLAPYRRAAALSVRISALMTLTAALSACSSGSNGPETPPACALAGQRLEIGDPEGHSDPLGAKAAGQARAGRIKDASAIPQPAHGRQGIEAGDFLLINDK